jgi:hypothetical protein
MNLVFYTSLLPGWHRDHVEVVNDASGTIYYFPCNAWLDSKEGDRATERLLKVRGQRHAHKHPAFSLK